MYCTFVCWFEGAVERGENPGWVSRRMVTLSRWEGKASGGQAKVLADVQTSSSQQQPAVCGLCYSSLCTRVHVESTWTFLSSFLCSLWKRRERGHLSRVRLGKEPWGLEEISHPSMELGSNQATSSVLNTMDYQSSKTLLYALPYNLSEADQLSSCLF